MNDFLLTAVQRRLHLGLRRAAPYGTSDREDNERDWMEVDRENRLSLALNKAEPSTLDKTYIYLTGRSTRESQWPSLVRSEVVNST